jgi:hypothetical protein
MGHPVPGAFTQINVNQFSLSKNITGGEVDSFLKSEAQGIQRQVKSPVWKFGDGVNNESDFLSAQDGGQGVLTFEFNLTQQRPGSHQGFVEKMLDSAVTNP